MESQEREEQQFQQIVRGIWGERGAPELALSDIEAWLDQVWPSQSQEFGVALTPEPRRPILPELSPYPHTLHDKELFQQIVTWKYRDVLKAIQDASPLFFGKQQRIRLSFHIYASDSSLDADITASRYGGNTVYQIFWESEAPQLIALYKAVPPPMDMMTEDILREALRQVREAAQ